jgi:hypothetical protein
MITMRVSVGPYFFWRDVLLRLLGDDYGSASSEVTTGVLAKHPKRLVVNGMCRSTDLCRVDTAHAAGAGNPYHLQDCQQS